MTTAEKLVKVAENREKIYNAGYEKGKIEGSGNNLQSVDWDIIQNFGKRNYYQYAFMDWNCEYVRPKYKVVPTTGYYAQLFQRNRSLKKVEAKYFDFSQIQMTDSQKKQSTYGNYYTFQFCYALEEIEDIGLNDIVYSGTFQGCKKLHTIEILRSNENTTYANAFKDCTSLENVRFEGIIGNTISFADCPLSRESLLGDEITEEEYQALDDTKKLNVFHLDGKYYLGGVIGALSDTATLKTITLNSDATVNALFAGEEFERVVAQKPNWSFGLA